jgi:hypothetical protein
MLPVAYTAASQGKRFVFSGNSAVAATCSITP